MMNELRSIARKANEQRPDWDLPGILTVLARLDITHPGLTGTTDLDHIRAATERAAADPKARTPAAITFARHWNPPAPAGPLPECANCRTPRRRDAPTPTRCTQCGRPWTEHTP